MEVCLLAWLRTEENCADLLVVERVMGYDATRHLLWTAQAALHATRDDELETLWSRAPRTELFRNLRTDGREAIVRLIGHGAVRAWLGLPGSRTVARPTNDASNDRAAGGAPSPRAPGPAAENSVTVGAGHETIQAGKTAAGDDMSHGNALRPGATTLTAQLEASTSAAVPGKRTLTESLAAQSVTVASPASAVQMQTGGGVHEETAAPAIAGEAAPAAPRPTIGELFGNHRQAAAVERADLARPAVQMRSGDAAYDSAAVQSAAARGVATPGSPLPHRETVQRSFGHHDVSQIQAHTGPEAAASARAMGAEAYATGDHVAFAGAPSLHTAAHEAAHVVQQRGGVQLKGGVGEDGDVYERHADAVADRVVRGESAEALLDQHRGGGSTAVVQRRSGNEELDRRVGTHGGNVDGSGKWGAEADDRGITDRANHYMWTRVALIAETMGLTNAARHMRHYLGNTGDPLAVNVDLMLRDVEIFRKAYDRQLADARQKAELRIAGMGSSFTNFQLTGDRKSDIYCSQWQSRDWYFAIGGFTYWYTADVQVVPVVGGPPLITLIFTMHIFDRYNWDQGKSITLAGMTVKDEQLGRLHRVGLAREYDVNGTSTPTTHTSSYTGVSTPSSLGTAPAAGDTVGGRADPSRERGRHFDNVRGSGN